MQIVENKTQLKKIKIRPPQRKALATPLATLECHEAKFETGDGYRVPYIAVTHHPSLRILKLLIAAWRAKVIGSSLLLLGCDI